MDLREIGLEGVDWIHVTQDRDWWWALVNGNEALDSIKCKEFLDYLSTLLASQEETCPMELINIYNLPSSL
jgi:hypothetical protein